MTHAVTEVILHTDAAGRPVLGIWPVVPDGAPPAERARVAAEASRAALLVRQAPAEQVRLLERLVGATEGRHLRFRHIARLERFLEATRGAPASDEALVERWRATDE